MKYFTNSRRRDGNGAKLEADILETALGKAENLNEVHLQVKDMAEVGAQLLPVIEEVPSLEAKARVDRRVTKLILLILTVTLSSATLVDRRII